MHKMRYLSAQSVPIDGKMSWPEYYKSPNPSLQARLFFGPDKPLRSDTIDSMYVKHTNTTVRLL